MDALVFRCLGIEFNESSPLHSALVHADSALQSDNNDFCSACGGSGYLLCCDGCSRSFHFTCCDPPLSSQADALAEPWYCFVCDAAEHPPHKAPHGLFSGLKYVLEKSNASSFSLPSSVRTYFEGIRAGVEGEYEEVTNLRNR